jgi:hypothetical protein
MPARNRFAGHVASGAECGDCLQHARSHPGKRPLEYHAVAEHDAKLLRPVLGPLDGLEADFAMVDAVLDQAVK